MTDAATGPAPRALFVETTTRCNLRCAMCVKHTPGNGVAEGDLGPRTFERLQPAFPGLASLVLSGVGEPLLHPGLEGFIRLARQAMPAEGWIGFQSNGLLPDRSRARSLVRAGLDRIVAVGMPVSRHPPHRSVREELPHTAPTSGQTRRRW